MLYGVSFWKSLPEIQKFLVITQGKENEWANWEGGLIFRDAHLCGK